MLPAQILTDVRGAVLLMRPDRIDAWLDGLVTFATGPALAELAAESRQRRQPHVGKSVGILPIHGTIVPRGGAILDYFGMVSTETIGAWLDALLANDDVGTILGDFDTPGGVAQGVMELADKFAASRGKKPMVAAVNPMAASAGLWLASAFDEVTITPTGDTGSVGAVAVHDDWSQAMAKAGVKRTYIRYGKNKMVGNAEEPLSEAARSQIESRVNWYGQQFESALARFRGVSLTTIRETWGQGRVLGADEAKAVGMVDRIETFAETLGRLQSDRPRIKRRESVEDQPAEVAAVAPAEQPAAQAVDPVSAESVPSAEPKQAEPASAAETLPDPARIRQQRNAARANRAFSR